MSRGPHAVSAGSRRRGEASCRRAAKGAVRVQSVKRTWWEWRQTAGRAKATRPSSFPLLHSQDNPLTYPDREEARIALPLSRMHLPSKQEGTRHRELPHPQAL